MKKIITLLLITATLNLSLHSCVTVPRQSFAVPYTQFHNLEDVEFEYRTDYVLLFFEGEKIDFEYTRIGIIETEGKTTNTNTDVVNFMKYNAWDMGADAIINVKDNYRVRETHFSEGEVIRSIYDVKVYSGLAVRIHNDSAFYARYSTPADTSFIDYVESRLIINEENKEKSDSIERLRTFGAILLLIAALALSAGFESEEEE